ncbi:nucleoporin Nup186/Nup192/Nup205 [Umbelopsis sp. PMI_123]|nr:nucleoporin Nup186/Nup192/Nup205 [Umbelopsis sp. PMI_123]
MTDVLSVPQWSQGFGDLHNLIAESLRSPSPPSIRRLRQGIEAYRPQFLQLLDDPPKNQEHRNTINSGRAIINGDRKKINDQFMKQTVFLSDQLNIDEHVAASLIYNGKSNMVKFDNSEVDSAITLYHMERGYLLECLIQLVIMARNANVDTTLRETSYTFIADLVSESVSTDVSNKAKIGTLPIKILVTIDRLHKQIESIESTGALEGAQPTAAIGTQPGFGKLGTDITNFRLRRLGDERIDLARLLYHVAALLGLDAEQNIELVKSLREREPKTNIGHYLLMCFFASTNLNIDNSISSIHHQETICQDVKFIEQFDTLLTGDGWCSVSIRASVALQWSLFLVQAVKIHPDLKDRLPFGEDRVAIVVQRAIGDNVFRYLGKELLSFQCDKDRAFHKSISSKSANGKSNSSTNNAEVCESFREPFIYEIEATSISFIHHMSTILRQMKFDEEDVDIPMYQMGNAKTAIVPPEASQATSHDLEDFITLLANVYRNRPEAGLKFWPSSDNGLHNFLKWVTEVRVVGTVRAVYEFLASLATGEKCALQTFHFFSAEGTTTNPSSQSLFSWPKLFAAINFYTPLLSNFNKDSPATLPLEEELVLTAFLRVFRQVILYSDVAKNFFWENESFAALASLINLMGCPTTPALRASLYNCIAAFCTAKEDGTENTTAVRCSQQIWQVLEDSGVLTTKKQRQALETQQRQQQQIQTGLLGQPSQIFSLSGTHPTSTIRVSGSHQEGGMVYDISQESKLGTYPETLAFVNLLQSLIHEAPKATGKLPELVSVTQSIPDRLGAATRSPGTEPYISLVIDEIFLPASGRKYNYPTEKWKVISACLALFEKSLLTFNLETLNTSPKMGLSTDNILLAYISHPGFEILKRLLSGSKFTEEIFRIVEYGVQAVHDNTFGTQYFIKCVEHCLSIISHTLKVQNTFCNVLVHQFSKNSSGLSGAEISIAGFKYPTLPSVVTLDTFLLYHANVIVQIALFVNCPESEQISLSSISIMSALSASPNLSQLPIDLKNSSHGHSIISGLGAKLTQVLAASPDYLSIIHGFLEQLEIGEPESIGYNDSHFDRYNIPFWITKSKTTSDDLSQGTISSSVRLAIVNLILENLDGKRSKPTIAHYILGYDVFGSIVKTDIKDPVTAGPKVSCLHAILALLQTGIDAKAETISGIMDEDDRELAPLYATHPILAEKCYQIIYRLCASEATSQPTTRYLRTREDFFYLQFKALPSKFLSRPSGPVSPFQGTLSMSDGTTMDIDFFNLKALLHLRTWLLKSIAIELHLTTSAGHKSYSNRLINLLYGTNPIPDDMDVDMTDYTSFQQPLAKMLEIFSSLDFTWTSPITEKANGFKAQYYRGFYAEKFQHENDQGCPLYDIHAAYTHLRSELDRQIQAGTITSVNESALVEDEIQRILEVLIAQNQSREIAFARYHCLRAWKQVVHLTLTECLDLIPSDSREHILLDLINALLPKLISDSYSIITYDITELLLACMTRLRDHHRSKIGSDMKLSSRLPDEKLKSLFRGILEFGNTDSTSIASRGNMYVTLLSFLLYIEESRKQTPSDRLKSHMLAVVNADGDNFIRQLYRDAQDGVDVWRTTANITLNALSAIVDVVPTST